MTSQFDTNTIIIGAGPAGLATAACLKKKDIPYLLLEKADQVGNSWHNHYQRLHLHTDKWTSALPYVKFPKDYPRYPSRQQVCDYLALYAKTLKLEARFNTTVTAIEQTEDGWQVSTTTESFNAPNLVIATGNVHTPHCPTWPGQADFSGSIIHSAQYKNGQSYQGQQVLVVGFGNSGGEIAVDLHEYGAFPSMAVRSAVNVIPRDFLGLPILAHGIALSVLPANVADALSGPLVNAAIGDLTPYGLKKLPYGPITQIKKEKRNPLINVGTVQLIKSGDIKIYPGISHFSEDRISFEDGQSAPFDSVILATGFKPALETFFANASAVTDADGFPLTSGRETTLPGLYFCGFYISPTGILREIAIEARRISKSIAEKTDIR